MFKRSRKLLAMLLGNNQGIPLSQFLKDGAPFLSELTHTAIPTRGALTPSFTRATEKRIPDHEGVLRTLIAGELGFPGARRVRNLLPSTAGAFNAGAGWTQGGNISVTSGVSDPDGGTTAYTITQTGATSAELYTTTAPTCPSPLGAVYIRRRTGSGAVWIYSGAFRKVLTLTTDWQQVTCTAADIATSNIGFEIRLFTNGDAVDFWHPQLEDITGRTDKTTPSEYVSVGVESSPAYHGSMVDGVKCFPTDINGSPLTTMTTPLIELAATNVLFKSNTLNDAAWTQVGTPSPTQNATGVDGATSAWTLTDNSAVATELILQNKTLTAATWTGSVFVEKTTGAQTSYPIFSVQTAATTTGLAQVTIDTSNGIATPWTAYTGWTGVSCTAKCEDYSADKWRVSVTFTGTAAAWYFVLIPAGTTNPTQSTGIYDVTAQGSAVFERAQLELGTAATSYIDNTSAVASATRNADQLYYTGADIANIKTLAAVDFKRESGFANVGIVGGMLSDGTNANTVANYLANATAASFAGVASSASQWSVAASNAYTPGTLSNMAQSFATNAVKISKDGITTTDADLNTATIPTVTRLEYGMQANAFQLNGNPGKIYGWTRNLSQSELNAVTA